MSKRSDAQTRKTGWGAATIAGMASYLDGAITIGTVTALVLFQQSMGISGDQIGQLSALLVFFFAIGALIGGRLGDRYGRRHVFTVTMILVLLGAVLMASAPSIGLFYVAVILLGAGAGADLPVSLAMIAENAPEGKEGRMVTYSQYLWMAGITATIILGIFVGNLGALGGRIYGIHVALVALVVLLLRFRLPESSAWTAARTAALNSVGADTTAPPVAKLGLLFQTRYRWPLIGTTLFYVLIMVGLGIAGFTSYLYVNVAKSTVQIASIMGLATLIVSFIGTTVLLRVVDSRRRFPFFIGGAIVNVASFVIPALLGVNVQTLVIMGICSTLGGAIAGEPMYKVWSQELFPTQYRSTAQGLSMFVARLASSGVALVTPALIAADVRVFFLVLAAATLAASAVGVFWLFRIPKAVDGEITEAIAVARTSSAAPERSPAV